MVIVPGVGTINVYVSLETSPPHLQYPTSRGGVGFTPKPWLDAVIYTAAVEAARDAERRGWLS